MFFTRFLSALSVCAVVLLSACGGGDGGTSTGPGLSSTSLTVSGAAVASNNGTKVVGTPTVTTSVVLAGTFTNVVSPLDGSVGSLSINFDATTGVVTDLLLTLGVSGQPAFLSASCGPCTGVTVSQAARSIAFVNTAVTDLATPPNTLATLNGTLGY